MFHQLRRGGSDSPSCGWKQQALCKPSLHLLGREIATAEDRRDGPATKPLRMRQQGGKPGSARRLQNNAQMAMSQAHSLDHGGVIDKENIVDRAGEIAERFRDRNACAHALGNGVDAIRLDEGACAP